MKEGKVVVVGGEAEKPSGQDKSARQKQAMSDDKRERGGRDKESKESEPIPDPPRPTKRWNATCNLKKRRKGGGEGRGEVREAN